MIVCLRTVEIPEDHRDRFLEWIDENRGLREEHGILFELVLQRSARHGPAKTLQPDDDGPVDAAETVVLTAWASHEAFDAWIETPDRDRLTDSDVHNAVRYGPITRYDTVGGYLNIDGLSAVAEAPKEEP
jgi:heme-degrading monooxygenase HmoA